MKKSAGLNVVLAGAMLLGAAGAFFACVSSGSGSDFDRDGLKDSIEDANDNFSLDPGESDFITVDTDGDGVCDGKPGDALRDCTGCEDCNDNGLWDPCLGETDPLNNDTDNDGIADGSDPSPLDGVPATCGFPYGSSLPAGKPFPVRPTVTPTPAPFPTSTPPPQGFPTPTPRPAG